MKDKVTLDIGTGLCTTGGGGGREEEKEEEETLIKAPKYSTFLWWINN